MQGGYLSPHQLYLFSHAFLFNASFPELWWSCCLPVTRERCPRGCPLPQCPRCLDYSAAWLQTLGLLCSKKSWNRVNRWRWWQPGSAQETDWGPVQQPLPQTRRNTETGPLHRLSRTQGTCSHIYHATQKTCPFLTVLFTTCVSHVWYDMYDILLLSTVQ